MADTTSTTTPTLPNTEHRRWADEEDDPQEDEEPQQEESTSSSSTAPPVTNTKENPDAEIAPPNLESLAIDETKKKGNDFLDDPEDSHISAVTGDTLYSTAATFESLKLSEDLLKGLYIEMKFTKPSKIQSVSLPMILTPPYKNLVAQAHNGSGKTTCFVLGMLGRVDPKLNAPQALCLCPTRELAIQNMEVLQKMGKYTGVRAICGVPVAKEVAFTKTAAITEQVIIGTPGTIKKWMTHKKLSMRHMKILVFDEADHMLDDGGFQDDSLRIMKDIERNSPNCQVLLFSATFSENVKNFVTRVVKDANQMFVKKEELSLDVVKQYKVNCPDELAKIDVIRNKIFELGEKLGQTIIFVHARESAKALHTSLGELGWGCTTIHGSLDKEDRDKIVKEFKDGLTQVLISTDLLSRGFDQSQVNLVINYDLPQRYRSSEPDYEVYMHRCGRAGRFGRKGAVFNLLCTDRDHELMDKIQKHFASEIVEIPDWTKDEEFEKSSKSSWFALMISDVWRNL